MPKVPLAQHMKGRVFSPFAALAFPNSKKVSMYCWVDREFCNQFVATGIRSSGLLHHSQVLLTTFNVSMSKDKSENFGFVHSQKSSQTFPEVEY